MSEATTTQAADQAEHTPTIAIEARNAIEPIHQMIEGRCRQNQSSAAAILALVQDDAAANDGDQKKVKQVAIVAGSSDAIIHMLTSLARDSSDLRMCMMVAIADSL